MLNRLPWAGDDFDILLTNWRRSVAEFDRVVDRLRGLGTNLRTQAEEQRQASRPDWIQDLLDDLLIPFLGDHPMVDPAVPQIPSAPAPPEHDPGAGKWNSQSLLSRGDDLAFYAVAQAAATAADAMGLTNAARHLRHYLNNTGTPLEIDPDRITRDVPAFADFAKNQAQTKAQEEIKKAIAEGNPGPITFSTGWEGFYLEEEMSQDWFYALGGVSVASTGIITMTPGEPPTWKVDYQTHVNDRYNWDGGKSVEIAGVTITDERMGALHTAGLASEFEAQGSSDTHSMTITGDTATIPEASTNNDGTRSDPGRDQQVGPSRISPGGGLR